MIAPMISTAEEAASLIRGFQANGSDLLAVFRGRDESFSFRLGEATAQVAEGDRLVLKIPGATLEMNLRGCRYSYADRRIVPQEWREAVEWVEGLLAITLPSGDALVLVEARPQPCSMEHEP